MKKAIFSWLWLALLGLLWTGGPGARLGAAEALSPPCDREAAPGSLSVPASLPDFRTYITSVSPNPASPGGPLALSCYLSNLGTVAGPSTTVNFYFSADSLLSANDLLLTTSTSPGPLAANTYATLSGTGTIPASTALGRYYVLCLADPDNLVSENDESNNLSFRRLRLEEPRIDLDFVLASAQPSPVGAGSVIQLGSRVRNQGNQPANPVVVGFYLSTDQAFDPADLPLGQVNLGSLGAGQEAPAGYMPTIPASTAAGTYYVLFVADPLNQLIDANRANNVRPVLIQVVVPNIDLLPVSATTTNAQPRPGETITQSCYMKNQGTTAAVMASLARYFSTDDQLDASDQLLGWSTAGIVNGGDLYPASFSFDVPMTALPGRYYLLFVADHQHTVPETNESNNVLALPLDVQPSLIDLTILQPPGIAPAPVVAGLPYTVSCTLANIGQAAAGSDRVGFYLSADATLDAADRLLNSPVGLIYNSLAASSTRAVSVSVTIPAGTAAGSYYLLAVADDLRRVAEANENNNVTYAPLTVDLPTPDLTVPALSLAASSIPAGTALAATATLANAGAAPASQSALTFYLSTNATFDASDLLLAATTGAALYPGQQEVRSASLLVPAAQTPGSYYVLAVADPLNAVSELNETNNVAARPLTVTAPYTGLVVPQSGAATATACAGLVTDNGGPAAYAPNSRGTLTLLPGTPGSRVQLTFSSFDTEPGADYLQVYDGPSTAAPLLGIYSGSQVPAPVTASTANASGSLTLQFVSDQSTNGAGFEAAIGCVQPLAVAGQLAEACSVLPNPVLAGQAVQVRLVGSSLAGPATLTLCNSMGQLVASRPLAIIAGQPAITELSTTGLAPGIYLLRLSSTGGQLTRRVVVE